MDKLTSQRRELFEQIMRSMSDLHRRFATSRDGFLAQFHLSRAQLDLLFAVKHTTPSTGELDEEFSVTPSAISQMIDQLEQRKLVERIADPRDKRITRIQLANDARRAFKTMRNQFIEHLSQRFCGVSDSELETLLAILNKTIGQIEKENEWKN